MSKSAIGAHLWAELNEAQRIEAVSTGRATLREMVEGLLDGPSQLRDVCRTFLAHSDICLKPVSIAREGNHREDHPGTGRSDDGLCETEDAIAAEVVEIARKRRQGLPVGYVSRLHKHQLNHESQ